MSPEIEKKFMAAFDELIDDDVTAALTVITGAFVSLTVSLVEAKHGRDQSDLTIHIDGGAERDITIHEAKQKGPKT